MNTIFQRGRLLLAIAGLCTFTGIVQAQNNEAAAPPPPATVEAPDANTPNVEAPDAPAQANDTDNERFRNREWTGRRGSNDRVVVGGNATLDKGQHANSVVSVFGSSTSDGDVSDAVVSVIGDTRVTGTAKDIVAVLGSVYLNGKISGDAVATMGDMELGPDAEVGGEVIVVGGTLKRDPGAIIHGGVQNVLSFGSGTFDWFRPWARHCLLLLRPLAIAPGLEWAWGLAVGFLALYVLLALLFRSTVDQCVRTLEDQPGKSIIAALLTTLLTPVMFALLLVTVIGIAFVPLVALGVFLVGLFGKAVMLAWIGRSCLRLGGEGTERAHTALAVLLGGVIVTLLYLVPFLGFIVYKALGILGLGVVVFTLIRATKERRGNNGPELAMAGAPAGGAGATFSEPTIGGEYAPSDSKRNEYGSGAAPGYPAHGFNETGASGATASSASGPEGWTSTSDAVPGASATTSSIEAGASNATGDTSTAGSTGAGTSGSAGSGTSGASSTAGMAGGASASGSASSAGAGAFGGAGAARSSGPSGTGGGGGIGGGGGYGSRSSEPLNNAAAVTYPRAGFAVRMGALFIDLILVAVLLGIVDSSKDAVLIALALYGAVMWKLKGTTIGGIVFGLKVIRVDGRAIDWPTATVRALSCFLSLVVAGLGFIWIAFDEGRQAWHDKIAGTAVVRVPRGVSLL